MDLDILLRQSEGMNLWLIGLALVLIICQISFLNMRWHSYLSFKRSDISFKTSSLINISGYFANIIFITSIGGIIAKSGLAMRQGLSFTQSIFITFLDRFMTLSALLVFSAISLPLLHATIAPKILVFLSLSVSGCLIAILLFVFLLRAGTLNNFIFATPKRTQFISLLKDYTGNKALMFKTSYYSLMAQACFILSVFALSLGMDNNGHAIPVIGFLALMPILALISSLPISFGGWGVREGAFIYGLSLIGFSMESAFFLSVLVGLVTLIAPFIVAIPYVFNTDIKKTLLNNNSKLS
ncbi:MAG: hypothetical protein COB14_05095 [Alphaproteobacteria bacterium]|nr:MAG: hypothetical protein COB14_05095 [Alphaproteobacteria bacterium]